MPRYDVTVTTVTRRTYQTSIRAKDEDTATERIQGQVETALNTGTQLPWNCEEDDVEIEEIDVQEI